MKQTTDREHAFLSASSAHRWLNCTPSAEFERQFPNETSTYAREGTLAHLLCEQKVRNKFCGGTAQYTEIQNSPLYDSEMEETSDYYLEKITNYVTEYEEKPTILVETKVEFDDYVPRGFGTCDCIIVGAGKMHVIDYKHGKGVAVSADNNPQLRLYALGALKKLHIIYDIQTIITEIIQPRVPHETNAETLTVDELMGWGESIIPTATMAYNGEGEYVCGDWCKFCRGRAHCRARAEYYTGFDTHTNSLSPAEIGQLLEKAKGLDAWYDDLKTAAADHLLSGDKIEGWKMVEGRSLRTFTDTDAAITRLQQAGVDRALIYDYKPKTLAQLEKVVGKKEFAETVGDLICRPQGKPTLAPENDKRPRYQEAKNDFDEFNDEQKEVKNV